MKPPIAALSALMAGALSLVGIGLPASASDVSLPPVSEGGHFTEVDGASLYRAICQGCHMPEGVGAIGAGRYPALRSNPIWASPTGGAYIVLHGRHGMPGFGSQLTDAQVAAVVNYVRTHLENHYGESITPADIAKLR